MEVIVMKHNRPKCFGKKNGYVMKCSELHHPIKNQCPIIEECYQKYLTIIQAKGK